MEATSAAPDPRLLAVVGVVEDGAVEDQVVADLGNGILITAILTVRCQVLGRRRGRSIGLELSFEY